MSPGTPFAKSDTCNTLQSYSQNQIYNTPSNTSFNVLPLTSSIHAPQNTGYPTVINCETQNGTQIVDLPHNPLFTNSSRFTCRTGILTYVYSICNNLKFIIKNLF